jgi:outer membrane protein assembly factor BamE (lipoprotein component of BamABCDE complex)
MHTHRVRIGADGKVKEVTELLREEQLASIIPGKTTRDEVLMLLGRPGDETTYRVGMTWSWRFKRMGISPSFMVVSFNPDGTVREKIVIVDPSGDSPPEN